MSIGVARLSPISRKLWLPWWMVAVGFAVLYVPSFVDTFRTLWNGDDQAHGPIVLGISLWLLYRKWPAMQKACCAEAGSRVGWLLLLVGLVLYVVGRSQDIVMFEIGSLIWMIAAMLALVGGVAALRAQWFSLFFMIFMIPLPGAIVDTVTMPMKMAVSYAAEHLLFAIGYPIARSGVVLQIGQYMLLVADACAGLHTLFTLEAMGLLYLDVVRHTSLLRNVSLAILIMPISFVANVIRVMVLTLITYHFGDEAGQGYMHGFAGMILFLSALVLILAVDSIIQWSMSKSCASEQHQ